MSESPAYSRTIASTGPSKHLWNRGRRGPVCGLGSAIFPVCGLGRAILQRRSLLFQLGLYGSLRLDGADHMRWNSNGGDAACWDDRIDPQRQPCNFSNILP
jgi:hypothetical protein